MRRLNVQEKLLEAATKCFHQQGFKGTTIEDIADAAGVLKGSFYNHFRSKEALAVLVVARYEDVINDNIALEGPSSALERLKKHFEWLASRSEEDDYRHGCLMSNFSVDIYTAGKPLRRALGEAFDRFQERDGSSSTSSGGRKHQRKRRSRGPCPLPLQFLGRSN